MGIGTSIFLIAIGAILAFAVDFQVSGVDVHTVGLILLVVGVIGALLSACARLAIQPVSLARPQLRACE